MKYILIEDRYIRAFNPSSGSDISYLSANHNLLNIRKCIN